MPEGLQEAIDGIASAFRWLAERWTISTVPSLPSLLLILTAVITLVSIPTTWRIVRHGATIIHEMGHVTVGWVCGRKVQGISLHSDTSGLTLTSGKERGLGVLLTYLAGYPAPALVGTALVWAALSGFSGAALSGIMLILILAFWLTRNAFGLVILTVALLAAGMIFWDANPTAVTTCTVAVGFFLVLAGTRTTFDLYHTHAQNKGGESDAEMASQHSLLPAMAWVYIFIAASFASVLLCAYVTVKALL